MTQTLICPSSLGAGVSSSMETLSLTKQSHFRLRLPTRLHIRRGGGHGHPPPFISAFATPRRESDPKKRVVITGMGLVSVFGTDVDVYYERLLAGESGVGTIDRFDASMFPTRFGGQIRSFTSEGYIDGKNDRRLDDYLRYCLVSGKKAIESAGFDVHNITNKIDKERAGILVGSGMGGLKVFSDGVQSLIEKGYRKITPFFIPYTIPNTGSALLGIDLGFMGPNYSISTACATSNYCIYAAANHIRQGDADLMVAGGTEAPIIPIGLGGFVACRALSTRNDDPQTASRPWDKDRDGFVMGEGAGILAIYGFRFMTFLGVWGSLLGSLLCFLKGCVYVVGAFTEYYMRGGKVIVMLFEAIDIYLLGTVMLVFGMGLYELFISNLGIAQTHELSHPTEKAAYRSNLFGLFTLMERPRWLEIQSINELKTKLGHVIVTVLLVGLFEKSKKVVTCYSTDLLCFSAAILLSSGGLYLLSKLNIDKRNKKSLE